MTADELRLRIAELLRDELEVDVQVQGKRLVVRDGDETSIVLVTAAKVPEPESWGPWVLVPDSEVENDWRSWDDYPLRYRVSTHGRVELGGYVVGGVAGTRIFRLPEGARPEEGDLVTARRFRIPDRDVDPGAEVEMLPRVLPDGSVMAPDPPNAG